VLDRYPPKESGIAAPPRTASLTASSAPSAAPSPTAPAAPGVPLITLDRGFDLDEFSSLLGQTSIRVTVPTSDLIEVLKRVTEFMGFGIYVYAVSLRPAPGDLLKEFVLELQRVDYSPEKATWVPFVEKGAQGPGV